MPRFRHRSSSVGSYQGGDHHVQDATTDKKTADYHLESTKPLLHSILYLRDRSGKSYLHTEFNLTLAKCLLDRAKAFDSDENNKNNYWQRRFLLQQDSESGYTPFHRAILEKNLAAMLLFLRQGSGDDDRLTQRPMTILHAAESQSGKATAGDSNCWIQNQIATATDKEGLTPLELLGKLQQSELSDCRQAILAHQPKVLLPAHYHQRRHRQSSFDDQGDDELELLGEFMDLLGQPEDGKDRHGTSSYACEVVTFGRPNHCALGVVQGSSITKEKDLHASTFSPQRVQEFAQDRVGRDGSAIAVAAATHHTLVVLRNGHLYAFGLGKGGRLGMEEKVQQCPLPRRVFGPLSRRKVLGVAAAENHSLCVTHDGMLFAWGSNRFGQLGENDSSSCRSLPRRVEDLKQISCVAVAAGEKHSVALSRRGEVYVWGDNTAGQLGVARRTGIQKVQRVEALWNGAQPKIAVAIAAAEQSTLVLASPVPGLTHINSIYSWGHGNHVPIRVHFDKGNEPQRRLNLSLASGTGRVVNPVAIACAKYHNAAVTSDGHVYTWGLHSESLGRTNAKGALKQPDRRNLSSGRATSSPQLVTGMLPEKGGGFAVAVSASEQHTAVVTDCGALFTWGTTHGNNVLGHEGVRWQPEPKRVPGVHRAINVTVAKEHTAILIGASFPVIPETSGLSSLELISAKKVSEHVDLFNVVPILIMAQRTESSFLIEYCTDFIRRNLDGVLNVGEKSVMNQYLNDMLADSLHRSGRRFRDDHHHPVITDVITAGNQGRPTFDREWFSSTHEWIIGCKELAESSVVQQLLEVAEAREHEEEVRGLKNRPHRSSSCAAEYDSPMLRKRSVSCTEQEATGASALNPASKDSYIDKCIKKVVHMDISTTKLAKEKSAWIAKEIRGVCKKLNQIAKLEETEKKSILLSADQRAKVDRRPLLEAELCVYETSLAEAEKRIKDLCIEGREKKEACDGYNSKKLKDEDSKSFEDDKKNHDRMSVEVELATEKKMQEKAYACQICGIKCPDKTSFELHQNGRRHRNRVSQAAEIEQKKAAKSIMKEHHMEQVKAPIISNTPPSLKKTTNAWGVTSAQPKYQLPPPPHPAVPPVTPAKPGKTWIAPSRVVSTAKSQRASPAVNSAKATKQNKSTRSTASPIWDSSPGSNRCVPLSVYSAPDLPPSPQLSLSAQRNTYSLADFLAPKPASPSKAPTAAPWSSEKASAGAKSRTLAQIQADEVDFKARQDQAYGTGGGSWFLERRERADSLLHIQTSAEKNREDRLLIEEQMRIEAQIKEDVAAQQEKEKKLDGGPKKRGPKRNNKKKPASKSTGNDKRLGPPGQGPNSKEGNKEKKKPENAGNSKTKRPKSKNGGAKNVGNVPKNPQQSNRKSSTGPKRGRQGNPGRQSASKEGSSGDLSLAPKIQAS